MGFGERHRMYADLNLYCVEVERLSPMNPRLKKHISITVMEKNDSTVEATKKKTVTTTK